MKSILYILFVPAFILTQSATAQENTFSVPKSLISPKIDGDIVQDEWKDAYSISFQNTDFINTKVYIKSDKECLYIAFENLINSNGIRLYPEILIDTKPNNNQWTNSCFWFHSSHSNCFSTGEYYNWKDCNNNPEGWEANTYPFVNNNNNIEFKISFVKLQLNATNKNIMKIAFKLSQTNEQTFYWPNSANIDNPVSWFEIEF